MNNLNFKKFRSDLAKEILTKPKNVRKEILMKAKQTDEYQQAEKNSLMNYQYKDLKQESKKLF